MTKRRLSGNQLIEGLDARYAASANRRRAERPGQEINQTPLALFNAVVLTIAASLAPSGENASA